MPAVLGFSLVENKIEKKREYLNHVYSMVKKLQLFSDQSCRTKTLITILRDLNAHS